MQQRFLKSSGTGIVTLLDAAPDHAESHGWLWIDIEADGAGGVDVEAISTEFELDGLAVRDAFEDDDLPTYGCGTDDLKIQLPRQRIHVRLRQPSL